MGICPRKKEQADIRKDRLEEAGTTWKIFLMVLEKL